MCLSCGLGLEGLSGKVQVEIRAISLWKCGKLVFSSYQTVYEAYTEYFYRILYRLYLVQVAVSSV